MGKIDVKFLKSLYPYSKGDVGQLTEERAEMRADKGFVEIVKTEPVKENKSMQDKPVAKKAPVKKSV